MRTIATVAAVSLAVSLAAQTKEERPGITNFTRIDAVFACAGTTETSALEGLARDGFKTVISLRLPTEKGADIEQNAARAAELGLTYLNIPFSGQKPDPKAADDFLAAIADTANQPVLVHCVAASRAGAMWLIKRVLQDGWTVEKATEEARFIGLKSETLEAFALDYISTHRK